jgi:hypothetical protein
MKSKILLLISVSIYCSKIYSQCTFGNYPPVFTSPPTFGVNYLLGDKYTFTGSSTITALSYKGNGTGAVMRMAIYSDLTGSINTLVAYTNTTTVGTGNINIPVITPVALPAGDYWILATYSGGSGTNHVNYTTSTTKTVSYITLSPTSIPPSTSGAWTTYTGQDFDYWAVVSGSATVSISPASSVICSGNSVNLNATGATSYSWSTGALTSTLSVSPTVNTTFTVVGTNSVGCTNYAITTITVNPNPTISVNSGVICSGSSFTMIPTGASTYTYSSGSAIITPTANTSYSVTGTSLDGCVASNTAVSSVTVNANPSVVASTSNSIICVGSSAVLTASTSATSYSWNTGATTMTTTVSPTVTTTYTVNVTNAETCVASSTVMITVNACTGVREDLSNLISIYPNPNNGILNINLTAELAKNSSLEVYDALGKLVVKQILDNELNSINISNLDNGMFTFKVLNNSSTIKIGKLIKQ